MKYAGAFRRLIAFLLDTIFLLFLYLLVGFLLQISSCCEPLLSLPILGLWWFAGFLSMNWLYFALLESSSWQATLGKKLLHIQVATVEGKRISFCRATARHFGKMVSRSLAFLGLLLIFFTKKKQTLHDKMASTVIIQR